MRRMKRFALSIFGLPSRGWIEPDEDIGDVETARISATPQIAAFTANQPPETTPDQSAVERLGASQNPDVEQKSSMVCIPSHPMPREHPADNRIEQHEALRVPPIDHTVPISNAEPRDGDNTQVEHRHIGSEDENDPTSIENDDNGVFMGSRRTVHSPIGADDEDDPAVIGPVLDDDTNSAKQQSLDFSSDITKRMRVARSPSTDVHLKLFDVWISWTLVNDPGIEKPEGSTKSRSKLYSDPEGLGAEYAIPAHHHIDPSTLIPELHGDFKNWKDNATKLWVEKFGAVGRAVPTTALAKRKSKIEEQDTAKDQKKRKTKDDKDEKDGKGKEKDEKDNASREGVPAPGEAATWKEFGDLTRVSSVANIQNMRAIIQSQLNAANAPPYELLERARNIALQLFASDDSTAITAIWADPDFQDWKAKNARPKKLIEVVEEDEEDEDIVASLRNHLAKVDRKIAEWDEEAEQIRTRLLRTK
jgi:hypothetical protein